MSSLFVGGIACTLNYSEFACLGQCIYYCVTGFKIMIVCCILPIVIVACYSR
jgi:hypothetical protein